MNILVIGNGFDLAHGLPTKYKDFLEFVKMIIIIKKQNIFNDGCAIGEAGGNVNNENLHQAIRLTILNKANNNELLRDSKELLDCIDNNFWLEYFLQCQSYLEENWIDFESEISDVIQSLDNDMHKLSGDFTIDDDINYLSNKFLNQIYSNYTYTVRSINALTDGASEKITFKEIRNRLLNDLNKLIRALEIYLCEYVEKIDIKVVSPDIKDIAMQINSDTHTALSAKVLSFNYTNTFEKLYDKGKRIQYDYIHGKADSNNTIDTNNMVLGIDEYLGKKKRNKQVDFIAFKKYYQRIHKQTGCKYKEWVDIIKGEFSDYQTELEKCKTEKNIMLLKAATNKLKKQYLNKHHVYIFGHSLDVTDKDILRELILNDNVHTTIFYYNKDVMGQQIANLVKVIGQDELIRRTGEKTIEFKQQQDMVNN